MKTKTKKKNQLSQETIDEIARIKKTVKKFKNWHKHKNCSVRIGDLVTLELASSVLKKDSIDSKEHAVVSSIVSLLTQVLPEIVDNIPLGE